MSLPAVASQLFKCPDCNTLIPLESPKCAFCGWVNVAPGQAPAADGQTKHGLCPFRIGELSCPLPATCAEGTGKGAVLWCNVHASGRSTDQSALSELQAIIADPKAFVDVEHWSDRLIAQRLVENHQLQRQRGESRDAFEARSRAEFLKHAKAGIGAGRAPILNQPQPPDQPAPDLPQQHLPLTPVDEDWIADFVDACIDLIGRHEDSGMPTTAAQQLAIESVLRERIGEDR